MADWHVPIEHLLEFAGEEERQHYLSPERTEAERDEIRAELEEVYQSIPNPTEAELRQFMGENTWTETQYNPSARDLPKAQWKSFRKADARKRLAESKRTTLGGSHESWWGYFYISHLDQKERDRIKRGEFEPREIEMLAKGKDPWGDHNPLPAGLEPPASLPPFDEWTRSVIEQFTPVAERVRQAAVDAAKRVSVHDHLPTPEERERTRKGLESLHSLMPPPPEKPKQIGQLLAEMQEHAASPTTDDKPKPYTQPKRVSKEEMAKLLRGEPPDKKKRKRKRKTTAPPPEARALNRYRLFRWLAGHPKVSGWSGLGMAGFALGIELSGAGKFAAVCYLVAWATWSLAIYFSPWWDKSRKGSLTVMVVLGIGLFGVWREYFPQPLPPVVREKAPELEPAPMITNAALRISDERFARTSFPLRAGQTVGVTFYTFNDGPGVAHNYHIYAHFGFIQRGSEEEMERATESMFQDVYRHVNKSTQDGEKGSDISPNDERFSSVGQNSVASADALAFNGKKKVLVALARIQWDNIQWAERCVYFLPEQVQEYLTSADHKIIWNQCKGHNDSGLRRSGSLL